MDPCQSNQPDLATLITTEEQVLLIQDVGLYCYGCCPHPQVAQVKNYPIKQDKWDTPVYTGRFF